MIHCPSYVPTRCVIAQGRVKLLSSVGSVAVLFNEIKESWRISTKNPVTVQVVGFVFFGNTLLAILHLEIAKKPFCCRQG